MGHGQNGVLGAIVHPDVDQGQKLKLEPAVTLLQEMEEVTVVGITHRHLAAM